MNLKITGIGDRGKLKDERIGIEVTKNSDLKFYQLFKTVFFDSETFSNRSEAVFWFPQKKVKRGDIIVIYSRKGQDSSKQNDDGTTVYWLYWGLKEPIFIDEKQSVILSELNDWQASKNI